MKLFGKEICLQKYGCSGTFGNSRQLRPFVNLYIKVTNGCNARCRFCCNAGCRDPQKFNPQKLFECINEICRSGIRLNRICLTGGEPSQCYQRVSDIISFVNASKECATTQLQLNTNGLSADARRLIRNDRLDVISVSLHHYDNDKLKDIYGCATDTDMDTLPGIASGKINVSCNLIRGYIDNATEVKKYLDFVASIGIPTVGFRSLMKKNEYCRKNFIDYGEIDFQSVPQLMLTRERHHDGHCKCRNYIYRAENGKMVEVYMRENLTPDYSASSLLFDGEYLRQGFNDNNNVIF